MDLFAKALLAADKVLEKSDYLKIKKNRYSSFDSGKGKAFESGELKLVDLYNHTVEGKEPLLKSGQQELLENILNNHI